MEIARRLAQSFGKVYYHAQPCERAFQVIRECCVGVGVGDIIRTGKPLSPQKLAEVDLWVFPDVLHSDKQALLESLGKPVWGSHDADSLELDREKHLAVLKETGLAVPDYHICIGITELRDYLRDKEDQYIKISRFRGDMETKHWRDWDQDHGYLDWLAVKFGPFAEELHWIVFPSINTDLEIGGDTYCIRGQWPNVMLSGLEAKDKSYFGSVTPTDEMPEQIQEILESFGPILGKLGMCNQWSMEDRVLGDEHYFIDPTPRLGLPSSASQLSLWTNFPEIVWAGAHGELLEPEYDDLFSMEVALCACGKKEMWTDVAIPDELRPHIMIGGCCEKDGIVSFPPDDSHDEEIGWLHAQGKTPIETLARLREYAKALPEGLHANLASLAEIIEEVDSAEAEGIPVTNAPMPEPEAVLE